MGSMLDTTLVSVDKTRIYLLGTKPRVSTTCGIGHINYLTTDGWVGVRLDDEDRTDEYGIATVKPVVESEDCPNCDGRGIVEIDVWRSFDGHTGREETCCECGGTGMVQP